MAMNTQDIIDQVREGLDEFNTETIDDDQILNVINKGQRKSANITSRRWSEIMLASYELTTTATDEYSLPADVFAQKIECVELVRNNTIWVIERVSQKDSTFYRRSDTTTTIPYYYFLKQNKIVLVPYPETGLTINVWYAKSPNKLVLPQGQIQLYNSTSNYITVDTLGSLVTTESTSLNNYLSIIDWQTGEIKATLQVSAIDTTINKITFKSSSLTRSSVLGQTISTSLPSDISEDDYICTVHGTCVCQLPEAYIDYITQFSIIDIKKRMGESIQEELAMLKEQETELKKMWAGRENRIRIRKTNSNYGGNILLNHRRYYI